MSDFIYLIIGIPIAFLIVKYVFVTVFKVYRSAPMVSFLTDDELACEFKISHGILYLLMDMWIMVALIVIRTFIDNPFSALDVSKMNFKFDLGAVGLGEIIGILLFLIAVFIIPILFIRYLIKYHKTLESHEFKNHSRFKVELTQFIVGIFSFWTFPLGVGVRLGIMILVMLASYLLQGSSLAKSVSYYRDEKGELQMMTTFTDKETGVSETTWRDSNGNLQYASTVTDKKTGSSETMWKDDDGKAHFIYTDKH